MRPDRSNVNNGMALINAYRVRREKAVVHSGSNPPGNWFAPPGSDQSSSGGNETAEASGAESRKATWRACRP
jgi:hypothetical protein